MVRNLGVGALSALAVGWFIMYPTSAGLAGTAAPARAPGPAAVDLVGASTVDGMSIDTRYGAVQVRIAVKAGRIVRSTAVAYPDTNQRDTAINGDALPKLETEALAAQSAQIDTVSGATYTSDAYRRSLQSAIDAAQLG